MKFKEIKISVLGLGYVGIVLANEFSKQYKCIGYDINKQRIKELKKFKDSTKQLKLEELKKTKLKFSYNIDDIVDSNVYVIAVPTPIFVNKKPNLNNLISASKLISKIIKKNDYVIYESTVYPGTTEEICIPILEKYSKLKSNKDFFVGYSPERINPSDTKNKLTNINKIVSSQSLKSTNFIFKLYQSIIKNAKIYKADSIKIAEAAKIIENTQRDINIALMNELSIVFQKLNINTLKVIDAASTKWNFLKFYPGLVGGHCIGVDPYYLTYKSIKAGYNPKIILSGRKINDNMGKEIAKFLCKKTKSKKNPTVNLLGLTFKENCNDIRNSKVIDIIKYFKSKNYKLSYHDPLLKYKKLNFHNLKLINSRFNQLKQSDILLINVAHDKFKKITDKKIDKLLNSNGIIYDLKGIFSTRKLIQKKIYDYITP